MNENTHTPGAWTKNQNIIEDAGGLEIARVSYERSGYVQANAKLIAAAPALLAALRYLVREATANGMLDVEPAIVQASAAIAKAKGGEKNV